MIGIQRGRYPGRHFGDLPCGISSRLRRSRYQVAEWRSPRPLRHTFLNPANAIALAWRGVRRNTRVSDARRAEIALHILISAKLFVGVAVLIRPSTTTRRARLV
jgi:hypothetical protein